MEHKGKKRIVFYTVLSLIVLVMLAAYAYINYITKKNKLVHDVYSDCLEESQYIVVKDGMVIKQSFSGDGKIDGIALKFSFRPESVTTGTVRVIIGDNTTGQELLACDQSVIVLKENDEYTRFNFAEPIELTAEEYFVKIEIHDYNENMEMKIKTANSYSHEGFIIQTEDVVSEDAVVLMGTVQSDKDIFMNAERIVLGLTIIAIAVAFVLLFGRKKDGSQFKIETAFLVVALLVGTAYCVMIPPICGPDEPIHMYSAYGVSNDILGIEKEYDGKLAMRQCDADLYYIARKPDRAYVDYVWENLFVRPDNTQIVRGNGSVYQVYRRMYIVPALGITLGRLLGFSAVLTLLLGRLFNVLLFAFAGYYAIKKIPFGKAVLFILCMLPITLQQMDSFSYDCFVNSMVMLIVATTLSLYFDPKEIDNKLSTKKKILEYVKQPRFIVMMLACLLLFPCKEHAMITVCMFPLMIPIRFIWRKRKVAIEKLKSLDSKKKLIVIGGIAAVLLCGLLVCFKVYQTLLASADVTDNIVPWCGQPGYTLGEFIKRPGKLIVVLLNTVWAKSAGYVTEFFGGGLCWMDLNLPFGLLIPFMLLLLLACFRKEDETQMFCIADRMWTILMGLGVIATTMLGMLLNWTPRYLNFIEGVQGRYFLPAAMLILVALRQKKACIGKDTDRLLIFIAVFMQIVIEIGIFKILIA